MAVEVFQAPMQTCIAFRAPPAPTFRTSAQAWPSLFGASFPFTTSPPPPPFLHRHSWLRPFTLQWTKTSLTTGMISRTAITTMPCHWAATSTTLSSSYRPGPEALSRICITLRQLPMSAGPFRRRHCRRRVMNANAQTPLLLWLCGATSPWKTRLALRTCTHDAPLPHSPLSL